MPITRQAKMKKQFIAWKVIYLLVGVILSGSCFVAGYFIHQNIITIYNSSIFVDNLSSTQNVDTIDMQAYDLASEAINLKERGVTIPADLRNVFVAASTTAPISTKTDVPKQTTKY